MGQDIKNDGDVGSQVNIADNKGNIYHHRS